MLEKWPVFWFDDVYAPETTCFRVNHENRWEVYQNNE